LHSIGFVRALKTTFGAGRGWAALLCAAVCSACDGPQSALDPAGVGAERLADLFFVLTAGAAAIWSATIALALYATYARREPTSPRFGTWLVAGAGAALPTVVLAGTLVYGLALLPPLLPSGTEGARTIEIVGEQWWWRVRYVRPDGAPIELANEIRLPVGEPVLLELASDDVIHSFWIPALGGKADMIPGRRARLLLQPTATGVYRGVCAEYCGTSHALMAFRAVVQEPAEFDAWLARQAAPAVAPPDPLAAAGADAFLANGCGACHAVRGTPALGQVGPDLTHVGSRLSLGAGILPNDPNAFLRFVSRTHEIKPSVHMPAFGMLPATELEALAAYLEALQ
jgi:cytochrome c oxidase subunit 2